MMDISDCCNVSHYIEGRTRPESTLRTPLENETTMNTKKTQWTQRILLCSLCSLEPFVVRL